MIRRIRCSTTRNEAWVFHIKFRKVSKTSYGHESDMSFFFLRFGQAVAAGMNPMDLRKGIKLATDHVVSVLSDISKPISTKEEVAQVGTISANRCAPSRGTCMRWS